MSCSENIDWKAYALGEMGAGEKREAAAHLAGCVSCREELGELQGTLAALATLREEEMPRRIAFVSDKVFEPRWWQRLNPTFAAASVLAAAILVHAFVKPTVDDATIQAIRQDVRQEVGEAVQQEMQNREVLFRQMDQQRAEWYMKATNLERQ